MISEGRGQGEGGDYLPWLMIGDFSSMGRGHRIKDVHTGRVHHLFSDLEASYYYLLAWADDVMDIREQYPLFPVLDTERIAETFGYKHPKAPGDRCNAVMTTDFLLTVQDGEHRRMETRHVKYEADWIKPREMQKRKIEEHYWKERGVCFKSVAEKSIHPIKVENIKLFLPFYSVEHFANDNPDDIRHMLIEIAHTLPEARYKALAARKILPVNIHKKFLGTQILDEVIDFRKISENTLDMEELYENLA